MIRSTRAVAASRCWRRSRWCSRRAARVELIDEQPAAPRLPASSTGGTRARRRSRYSGKKGGTLHGARSETDFEHLDPGIAYYSLDYEVMFATQRPLYSTTSRTPPRSRAPTWPSGPPEVTNGGKTVTVHLQEGVHFSPPVNREVTVGRRRLRDRARREPERREPVLPAVLRVRSKASPKATGGPIAGITTPNKHTIVFNLTEPKAQLVADALVLPLTAAVPKEYAEKFDKNKPSELRQLPGRDGPVHAQERRDGQGARRRLHPRQVGDAGSQPELEREARTTGRRT